MTIIDHSDHVTIQSTGISIYIHSTADKCVILDMNHQVVEVMKISKKKIVKQYADREVLLDTLGRFQQDDRSNDATRATTYFGH